MNRTILIGRLTRDPELRKTNSGVEVVVFTVACDNRLSNPDGSKSTSFFSCVAFGGLASSVTKYTRKGNLVAVDGYAQQRKYEKQDGSKGVAFEIVCDSVEFLESKPTSEAVEGETKEETDGVSKPTKAKKASK